MSQPTALTADERRALLERIIAADIESVSRAVYSCADTVERALTGRTIQTNKVLAIRDLLRGTR
jgi:hypothetical protein